MGRWTVCPFSYIFNRTLRRGLTAAFVPEPGYDDTVGSPWARVVFARSTRMVFRNIKGSP